MTETPSKIKDRLIGEQPKFNSMGTSCIQGRYTGELSKSLNPPSHHLKSHLQLKTKEVVGDGKASYERLPGKAEKHSKQG